MAIQTRCNTVIGVWWMLCLAGLMVPVGGRCAGREQGVHETFGDGTLNRWRIKEGTWRVREDRAVAEGGFGLILHEQKLPVDFQVSADVAYCHDGPHAASGLLVRYGDDGTGYAICLREIEKGIHPDHGPWERPVLQLFRLDPDGWELLQESKVIDCRSGRLHRIRIVCRGPNIWVFYAGMARPFLSEYDPKYVRAGWIGLWKDHPGEGLFDNISAGRPLAEPALPSRTDWSWVRGAVYIRSNAVNSVQMWHDYWDHTAILDRELSYASLYGLNMVQAYLHWIVWDRHREEYLRRIDDFLERASRHGLRANLIFWDDCGHVEPGLSFATPVPGRHNSQMMPNPSHTIRDSAVASDAHKERFRSYVEGIASRFRDDRRIAFWQIYNECMGPREKYRLRTADSNLNRLLGWTRAWIKGTGTSIPITATGGGFYGPQYSDFYSYHSYRFGKIPFPHAGGGPEHLCTETLNRPDAGLADCVRELAGKQNGFVVWELMIGRDNCRFPWGHPDGRDEPAVPFQGIVYPDGHPWDAGEIKALLGDAAFSSLTGRIFQVEYFAGEFRRRVKQSITPRIDFDLGDEPGYGSPDASAGLGRDDFSIRWTGRLVVPVRGTYTFFGDSDGLLRVRLDATTVVEKIDHVRREARGEISLHGQTEHTMTVEYHHTSGPASTHLSWSGPGLEKGILLLNRD